MRSRIVRVATDEWNTWARGTKQERDPEMTPQQFAAHLEQEQKKWGRVIKERGIRAE